MQCPGCGLYNPSQRQVCASCGTRLVETADPVASRVSNPFVPEEDLEMLKTTKKQPMAHPYATEVSENIPRSLRRDVSPNLEDELPLRKPAIPTGVGIIVAVVILLISAGVSIYIFSGGSPDRHLLDKGEGELSRGQYAFAVKTLTQAVSLNPKDSKALLALARAYVGVDQIDKAWDCIMQAQQLGTGLIAEPTLASDLANYYRQRGEYEKAIELLRPLAKADISGKKAELADLDALWGDEALKNSRLEQALTCWEEVKDLHDGSRFGEADSRLTTIYQKLASTFASSNDDTKALDYLSKLNTIAQNSHNYELASDIYGRDGQTDLAIDQLRQAIKLDPSNTVLNRKLAVLLQHRGKELLDQGKTDEGFAFLQQAKEVDPKTELPDITLRNVEEDHSLHEPKLSGEIWNPGQNVISNINMKVELWDQTNSKVLWTEDRHIVDEYDHPLSSRESKPFVFSATVPAKTDGTVTFRVFLNGSLYKIYPIGKKQKGSDIANTTAEPTAVKKNIGAQNPEAALPTQQDSAKSSSPGTSFNYKYTPPSSHPSSGTATPTDSNKGNSSEEKTMKDLDL